MAFIELSSINPTASEEEALTIAGIYNSQANVRFALTRNLVTSLYEGTTAEIAARKANFTAAQLTTIQNHIDSEVVALNGVQMGLADGIELIIRTGEAKESGAVYYSESSLSFMDAGETDAVFTSRRLMLNAPLEVGNHELVIDFTVGGTFDGDEELVVDVGGVEVENHTFAANQASGQHTVSFTAAGLTAQVFGTSVNIRVYKNGVEQAEQLVFNAASEVYELTSPIAFAKGDRINLRTGALAGVTTDAQLSLGFEIEQTIEG